MFNKVPLTVIACKSLIEYKEEMASVTHRIDDQLKAELEAFCEAHGLKQQAVLEAALAAWLEDAEDLALMEERKDGPFVAWEKIKDEI